jgi:hypothetical protein
MASSLESTNLPSAGPEVENFPGNFLELLSAMVESFSNDVSFGKY